jgi:hypothetical protein
VKKIFLILIIVFLFFIFSSGVNSQDNKDDTQNLDSIEWNQGDFKAGEGFVMGEKPLEKHRLNKRAKPKRKMLLRKKALAYIGDLEEKLLSRPYSAKIFIRRKIDRKRGRRTDGIIFNTDGGNFGFWTHSDGFYELILDTEGGRTEEMVTKERLGKYFNYINDEKLTKVYVIFDKEGNEAALLYMPFGTLVKQYFTDKDNVFLEIETR